MLSDLNHEIEATHNFLRDFDKDIDRSKQAEQLEGLGGLDLIKAKAKIADELQKKLESGNLSPEEYRDSAKEYMSLTEDIRKEKEKLNKDMAKVGVMEVRAGDLLGLTPQEIMARQQQLESWFQSIYANGNAADKRMVQEYRYALTKQVFDPAEAQRLYQEGRDIIAKSGVGVWNSFTGVAVNSQTDAIYKRQIDFVERLRQGFKDYEDQQNEVKPILEDQVKTEERVFEQKKSHAEEMNKLFDIQFQSKFKEWVDQLRKKAYVEIK